MNEIIRNLTIQNLKNFISSFEDSKDIFYNEDGKPLHNGEFGTYREELVKKWLSVVVPERFGISSGFLVTSKGSISTQCDIIIYDKMTTPKIESMIHQRFFPVETVSCIGEVKSNIGSMADLNNYLIKLSDIKKLREEIINPIKYYPVADTKFFPDRDPSDNLFSFLICNKFNFEIDISKIDYQNVEQRFKHNVVLSLHDGMMNYQTANIRNITFPFNRQGPFQNDFQINNKLKLPHHIQCFLNAIHYALLTNSLLDIDMAHYIADNVLLSVDHRINIV